MSPAQGPDTLSWAVRVPHDREEARALLQQRLALFAKVIFLLSFGFYVLVNLLELLDPGFTWQSWVTSPGNLVHLGATAVALGIWLLTRRSHIGSRVLGWIDATGIWLLVATFGLTGLVVQPARGGRFELVLMLIALMLQMLRAVVIPSAARQTAIVGGLVSLTVMAETYLIAGYGPDSADLPLQVSRVLYVGIWCLSAVIVATLASRVIYGLRAQVEEARRLGQYTLEEELGAGGMGIVYRARHAMLRRPTAVKLLPPDRSAGAAVARFEREVQLTSQLTHPNTIAIYDYGRTPDGVFYYAMEYLDGLNLEQVVEIDGAQDPSRVVHLLSQVCGALAEAHGLGLIHRDIKPANIFICERGGVPDTAKVLDFGLVKSVLHEPSPDGTALSNVNTIMGTPLFLAPEVIVSAGRADARSDLYALGAVAYFLLTGQMVFDGASIVEICGQHLHSDPILPSKRAGRALPEDLEALVLQCLEKDPARRPDDAESLRQRLLACNVPPWSVTQARDWWQRCVTGTAARRAAARRNSSGPPTLAVDLADRTRTTADLGPIAQRVGRKDRARPTKSVA